MSSETYKGLIDHISRLEGQLASIKRELQDTHPNCLKTSTTLRAASRSFTSLKHSFVQCFLGQKFLTHKQAVALRAAPEYTALLDLIRA